MKSFVVITSIFEPTKAVKEFASFAGLHVVVAGDKKSPTQYELENVTFLGWEEHEYVAKNFNNILPFNHYCRKMIGYLHAIKDGADIIIDTDDDNIPKANWKLMPFDGRYSTVKKSGEFVNVYELYTEKKVWPRGLPLNLINSKTLDSSHIGEANQKIGIWQGLADEDPDVDAIYRLTDGEMVYFNNRGEYVLQQGTVSPFNSQNTIFRKEMFPLLYLPCTVTFRFTDILRGLVAQPVMWSAGYSLGFTDATVTQERNPHDFVKDFESEVPMFLNVERVIDICASVCRSSENIPTNLFNSYSALEKGGVVKRDELAILSEWLEQIS